MLSLAAVKVSRWSISDHEATVKVEKTPVVSTVLIILASSALLFSPVTFRSLCESPVSRENPVSCRKTLSPIKICRLSAKLIVREDARPSMYVAPSAWNSAYERRVGSPVVKDPIAGESAMMVGNTGPLTAFVLILKSGEFLTKPSLRKTTPAVSGIVT